MTNKMRGLCATCHWWTFTDVIPGPDGQVRNGTCSVKPPVPQMIAVPAPGSMLQTGQYKMVPKTIGIIPPALETGKCEKWAAQGTFPPPDLGLQ